MRLRILLLLSWLTIGCGAAPDMKFSGGAEKAYDVASGNEASVAAVDVPADAEQALPGEPEGVERKIVYTAQVQIVVEEFDELRDDLQQLIEKYDAYVSGSNTYVADRDRRRGTWTIRVPVASFEAFLQAAEQLGELQSTDISSEDRTAEYYDLDAALKNKQATLERLKKLADRHEGDLEHIRQVEADIERVQGEIDRLNGRLKLLQNLTAYTTVTLTVSEIKDYVPAAAPTFGTQIERSFSQSVATLVSAGRNLVLFSVAAAPWLVLALIALLLVRLGWRWLRRDSR